MTTLLAITLSALAVREAIAEQEAQAAKLHAGVAAVDVSPTQFPLNMPGGFRGNLAEKNYDPFHSRAIVLSDGETTIAMVVVDNLGVEPEVIQSAKEIAAEETGIPTEKMMVSSTHTHSGPSSGGGNEREKAYQQQLREGIAESIVQAHEDLQPAALGAASHPLPDEVFNRRWYLKPGRMPLNPFGEMDIVKMNPPRSPDVLDRPAGPTDPDVSVISIEKANGRPLGLFANYSLHYVGAIPRGQMSADYFGEFARLMPVRLRAGEDFVAMMSNGTSGDINNIPFGVTRPPREPFEQVSIVARKTADAAWFAVEKIDRYQRDLTIDMREREITLRHRRPSPALLKRAKEILEMKDPEQIEKLPRLAQIYARRTVRMAELPSDTVTVKLQAIRIGDIAICAIPFETFVEIGLDLKDRSPMEQTIVVGLANGRYGYLPTPRQHRLGGYETWLGTNKVQKDASEILVRNLMEMLEEVSGVGRVKSEG